MQYERFIHQMHGIEKQVYLVDMKEDARAWLFSSLAKKTLDAYVPQWKKILIVWWKKWLAAGIMCQDCGYIPKCNHCDIPVAFHKDQWWQTFWICHICKKNYQALWECPQCHGYHMDFFGTWMQKMQTMLLELYPTLSIQTIDASMVSSIPKITTVMQHLHDVQCVIATSLLQEAPHNWKPDIVIVIRADSMLSIPDRKVSEHCYHMLDACIKNYTCPTIVQAYSIWHHAILAACKQQDTLFWQEENTYRQQFQYPPYTDMALILYKHEVEETMFTRVNKLYQELLFLQKSLSFEGEIYATPPLIYKMYDKYRYNIVLKGKNLHDFLEKAFLQLKIRDRGFKIDWLPENIS